MVSDMNRAAVRIGPGRCPDWSGTGPDKEWSDAGMAVRVTVRSMWIEKGNLNGTKDINHASNTRNPSTQISKPIIDPENCPQLRTAHQYGG